MSFAVKIGALTLTAEAMSTMMAVLAETRDRYEDFLRRRHGPAHRRRTADRWAAFLQPHLFPAMRVLDIGCGPGSITVGLTGNVIGVDLHPTPVEGVPVVGASGEELPFPDRAFDALYMNALLQHVANPSAVLGEARRVARPGAVIGVGDADWGTRIIHPHDRLITRGVHIQEAVRAGGNVRVGRELRGLLTAAGFEHVELGGEARVVSSGVELAHMAAFESAWFEEPEVIDFVAELGESDRAEMSAIARAWPRWSSHPSACLTDVWFTALARAPASPSPTTTETR